MSTAKANTGADVDVLGLTMDLSVRIHRLVNLISVVRDAPEQLDADALLDIAVEYAEGTLRQCETLETIVQKHTQGMAA